MPNIVICGTPGTGKSSLISKIEPSLSDHKFINLSKFAIENKCISSFDKDLDTQIIDEEKLEELLEPILKKSRTHVLESIHADLIGSTELIDWIFVCRTENSRLYDRLVERKYSADKISNNIESEIFQTILDESRESFGSEIVTELHNNTLEDLDKNAKLVLDRIKNLKSKRK